jgi:hypothetical protein
MSLKDICNKKNGLSSFVYNKLVVTLSPGFSSSLLYEGENILLVAEPDNSFDPNAIKVYTTSMDFVGYVLAAQAKYLAPIIEHGKSTASVLSVEPLRLSLKFKKSSK